jgi:hypothetical protein
MYRKTILNTKSVIFFLGIALFLVMSNTSCKKDKVLTSGGDLKFSADTVKFDTVFTTMGSFTTQIKIYNPQSQKINISRVWLDGTDASFFHLNVNGISGNDVSNIELAAKDSMYVFATVTVDPNKDPNNPNPFVIEAMMNTTMNGKSYQIPFRALGQNAHYIYDDSVGGQTWGIADKKPYVVIYDAIVERGKTLTIAKGTRIYMHAGSLIYIDGTLTINGTKKDSVIFQGDRLDRKYFGNEGYPGEWGGLYFTPHSSKSTMDYAILKNCGGGQLSAGIQLYIDSVDDGDYQLRMNHCIVDNSISNGILGYASSVYAKNCQISNCGGQSLVTYAGGQYDFDYCDFVCYGNKKLSHSENPVMALINYYPPTDPTTYGSLFAHLRNCIIWGSLETELYTNKVVNGGYTVTLDNCLYKSKDALESGIVENSCIANQDPKFVDYNTGNFRLQSGSPAIDKGLTIPAITDDLDGKARNGTPDIGCYEY